MNSTIEELEVRLKLMLLLAITDATRIFMHWSVLP
jgi:hypothetical protein